MNFFEERKCLDILTLACPRLVMFLIPDTFVS